MGAALFSLPCLGVLASKVFVSSWRPREIPSDSKQLQGGAQGWCQALTHLCLDSLGSSDTAAPQSEPPTAQAGFSEHSLQDPFAVTCHRWEATAQGSAGDRLPTGHTGHHSQGDQIHAGHSFSTLKPPPCKTSDLMLWESSSNAQHAKPGGFGLHAKCTARIQPPFGK